MRSMLGAAKGSAVRIRAGYLAPVAWLRISIWCLARGFQ